MVVSETQVRMMSTTKSVFVTLFFAAAAVAISTPLTIRYASLRWIVPWFSAAVVCATGWRVYRLVDQSKKRLADTLSRRERILSTLAHELRTPLTVIRSSAGILLDGRTDPLNERQLRFARGILSNSERLEILTENILADLKIERWQEPIRLRATDLRKLITATAQSMESILDARDQRMHYVFPSLLSRAMADPEWWAQVLVNLIHNASKYTPPGGTIELTVNENERCLVISVSDNGAGIRGRGRPDVMQEFVQGRPGSEQSIEGTGLGLAIVRRVIELHGGEVHVASRPESGTTVSCTLEKVVHI